MKRKYLKQRWIKSHNYLCLSPMQANNKDCLRREVQSRGKINLLLMKVYINKVNIKVRKKRKKSKIR